MFGKENGSEKSENTVVFRPVCTVTSLVASLICQSKSSETSGKWKNVTSDLLVRQVKQMTLDTFFKK
jgi:hypothetical protein